MSPGRLIGGRYEIVRKIAEGGMGAVYEAQHNLSKKTVALKILFPHIGRDEAARQRFTREVSAPAQIGHDGIVEVLDAGFDTQDGSLFVAMEMLRGETLRDRLARGGLTRDQVLDMFELILDPLAAAHAKGIVHRDLKPENVYLHRLRDGREVMKLLDFGIARDLDAQSQSVTQTGIAMGTPHYMAPEQAMSARSVSCPADVWAIGAMLYEALAGKTPFDGETASAIVVHAVSRPHEPLAHAAPATPHAIGEIVDRCLAKDPEQRPKDAGALLAELRAARARATGAARPSPIAATHAMPVTTSSASAPASATSATPATLASPPTYGTPSPTPSPYGTPVPAPGYPTPPHVTPPPAVSHVAPPRARGGGGLLKIVLAVGALLVLGFTALVVVVAVGTFTAVRNATSGDVGGGGGGGGPQTSGIFQGELAPGDGRLQSGEFADTYEFSWSAGQHVHVEARSTAFDTYLILRYPSGRQRDNDDAIGTDSMLDLVLDETGPYRLMVTSFRPGETGAYSLTVQ